MKLDILLSTMHMKDADEIKKLNISGNCIVVNQCDEERVEEIQMEEPSVRQWILHTKERGLSRSRNMALFASNADICKLSDDDLSYEKEYEKLILKAFMDYPKADVICFHVNRPERTKPTYPNVKKLNYLTTLKVCSVEIAFRKEKVEGILFREDFGTGSKQYLMGEENIFLYDCLKKGLNVFYVPCTIGSLLDSESTWNTGYHKEFFKSRGANYYAMSRGMSCFLIGQFALRKYRAYADQISFKEAVQSMYLGRKELKNKDILFVGDYFSTTGPAIVTKEYMDYLPSSVRTIHSKNKVLRYFELLWKLHNSKIILFSGLSKQNIICVKHGRKYHKKTAYLMHGSVAYENEVNLVSDQKLEELEREILDKVDVIFTVSSGFLKWMQKRYASYREKMVELTNGVNWRKLKSMDTEIEECSCDSKDTVIRMMSVGGGMPRKNILLLCQVLDEIRKESDRPLELLVVGEDGKDSEAIQAFDFVKYLGVCSHEQVLNDMKKSDIYIQNSIFETFGIAPIEAALMGCKVIISDRVGAKEIMREVFALSNRQIVNDPTDALELKTKILDSLQNPKEQRIIEETMKYKVSVPKRSMELFQYLNQL